MGMATGKEIKRLRGKKTTAAEAAALMGVGVDKLRKWEERDTDPSDTGDIQKVESYFGCSLDELKGLKSFDFVEYQVKSDKDKIIALLEKEVKKLEEDVSSLKGELIKLAQVNQSILMTNQNLLIELVALQKRQNLKKVADETEKANFANYNTVKKNRSLLEADR